MIKNNYCLNNNINLLRINYIDHNIINNFIVNISNGLYQAIIPTNNYYMNISNDIL